MEHENDSAPKTYDEAYIRKLNAQCKRYRLQGRELEEEAAELQKQIEQYEAGEKSPELVAGEARVAELEKQILESDVQLAEIKLRQRVDMEAQRLGISDLDAAYKLVNTSTLDDTDASVKQALESVVRRVPGIVERRNTPVIVPTTGPFHVGENETLAG